MKNIKSIIIKLFGVLFILLGVAILMVSVDLYYGPSENIDATVVKVSTKNVSGDSADKKEESSVSSAEAASGDTKERYKITWNDKEGESVEYNYTNKDGHQDGDIVQIRVDSKTLKYRVPDQDGFTKCMVFGTLFVLAGLAIIFLIKPVKKSKTNMFGQF